MPDARAAESPAITLDEQSIVDFARLFDPQPYHLDRAAADASIFGGLCASGWQVGALASRLTGEALAAEGVAYITTTKVNHMRWLRPTFVDDQLIAQVSFGDTLPSSPVPGCDSLDVAVVLKDAKDQAVAEMTCRVAVAKDETL
ncbi:MaoC/PaaZ C-terminal domain-containing protein [Luminiphilus sp. nBUS_16]|uniref:MaoC/PaaZ C-terminal domain-containing protein n=1 Tax=unclassified Luminiphilus TaxID=2633198 RepID=UPI003EB9A240